MRLGYRSAADASPSVFQFRYRVDHCAGQCLVFRAALIGRSSLFTVFNRIPFRTMSRGTDLVVNIAVIGVEVVHPAFQLFDPQ
jgi:hypothetical protein